MSIQSRSTVQSVHSSQNLLGRRKKICSWTVADQCLFPLALALLSADCCWLTHFQLLRSWDLSYPFHSTGSAEISTISTKSPKKVGSFRLTGSLLHTQKNHEKGCSFPTSLRWPLAFIVPASRTSGVTRPRPSSHAKPQYKQSLQNFPQLQFALFVPFQPVSRRLRFRWTWSPN